MPEPLITELRASRAPLLIFPEAGTGALGCLEEIPPALRRPTPPALPALDPATLSSHFDAVAALPANSWPSASLAARAANLPGLSSVHPSQPAPTVQGALGIIHEVVRALAALTGLDRFSLQPSSIESAERAALLIARAALERTQPGRVEVVAPAASPVLGQATELGLVARPVERLASGDVAIEALDASVGDKTALVVGTWLTPQGRFERNLDAMGQLAHLRGALFAVDAAGLGILAGRTRLREVEADIAWFRLAELCPVALGAALGVRAALTDKLPSPLVAKARSGYELDTELPGTIGPLAVAPASLADALAVYVVLRTLGAAGLLARADQLAAALP